MASDFKLTQPPQKDPEEWKASSKPVRVSVSLTIGHSLLHVCVSTEDVFEDGARQQAKKNICNLDTIT